MRVLFECDQCAYREWRDETDEPYLCPVCGHYRWSVVVSEAGDADGTEE